MITFPATAIVGMIVFSLCFMSLLCNNKLFGFITPIKLFAISGTISFLIIYVKIQNLFYGFIKNVLHKDLTFSGRTEIWNLAIDKIKNNLILGYGRLTTEQRTVVFNATSAHNQFLNFLFEGGVGLLLTICVIFIIISKKLKECNNKKIRAVITATIASYLFMWITEPFSYSGTLLMFIIFMIAYYSDVFFEKDELLKGEK